MKKDWRSLLWCTILVGTTGASEDDSKLDQCKDRLSRYYRSHFEDENELHVPNACQSCCCSNNTNQIDCSGLSSNTIKELILARDEMPTITHIYLNSNELDNLSHFQLMNVSSVRAAEIRQNRLRTFEVAELEPFTQLRKLDLESNEISQIQSGQKANVLEVLNLAKNKIESIGRETFGGFDNLRVLDLSKNELDRIESSTFVATPKLEVLRLEENQITSLDSNSFDGLDGLMEMDLSGNEISSLPDGVFSSLNQLRKLVLRRNEISFVGTESLMGLSGLHYLDLTSNWIASVHPDAFKDLPIGFKNQIELNDNPLMCDCELRHLVSWITHWPFRVINAKNLRCSFVQGAAAKNAGKRLLELQSHDLCDWFTELRDMILVPVVILIIISLVVVLVCVLRSRRRKSDGSMATMSTNYKSQVQDSFSISSSHHGSSDFTQATNVPKFNIHLPASLQPATFSPPPPTQVKDKHEMAGERITRRHTTRHGATSSSGHEQKKNTAKRTQSQYQQRRRASYNHQKRRHESVKKKHYSSTESDSESSYSEDGL